MPRIHCHYLDCIFLGCKTYRPSGDMELKDWDEADDIDEWDDMEDDNDEDLWIDEDEDLIDLELDDSDEDY